MIMIVTMMLLDDVFYNTSIGIINMMFLFCGAWKLMGQKRKSDSNKYIILTDSVYLTTSSCYLHSPFNFDLRSDIIIAK